MTEALQNRPRGRPKAWHDTSKQNTVKSLDRAMAVFERLSEMGDATLTELAEDTGQSTATVYRILSTLEARGLVEIDSTRQTWGLGTRAFVIGARYLRRTSLADRARPILRALMEATGETANLGVERGGQVLFVSQVETHESIRAFFPPGTLASMHSSGIGKAILAHMNPVLRDGVIERAELTAYTPRTLITRTGLKRDLDAIRARGFSIDDEERNLGMRCIAAPVFDAFGDVVAGLSISGPTSRVSVADTERLAREVTLAASRLTKALGG